MAKKIRMRVKSKTVEYERYDLNIVIAGICSACAVIGIMAMGIGTIGSELHPAEGYRKMVMFGLGMFSPPVLILLSAIFQNGRREELYVEEEKA